MFKPENVAAVPPHLWHHEYHCAALAGKDLEHRRRDRRQAAADRLVQERDRSRPPTRPARTHRPFSFRNEAGHVFSCNGFPPTEDQTNAFWDRWSGVEFRHTRPPENATIDSPRRSSRPSCPACSPGRLRGAAMLAANGGRFIETGAQGDVGEWRGRTDSVRSWLLDPEAIELLRDHADREHFDEGVLAALADRAASGLCAWCHRHGGIRSGCTHSAMPSAMPSRWPGLCEDRRDAQDLGRASASICNGEPCLAHARMVAYVGRLHTPPAGV